MKTKKTIIGLVLAVTLVLGLGLFAVFPSLATGSAGVGSVPFAHFCLENWVFNFTEPPGTHDVVHPGERLATCGGRVRGDLLKEGLVVELSAFDTGFDNGLVMVRGKGAFGRAVGAMADAGFSETEASKIAVAHRPNLGVHLFEREGVRVMVVHAGPDRSVLEIKTIKRSK